MRAVGGALVHEFLISYSRTGWCFQARAWVLYFQRLCSWSIMYEFHHLVSGWLIILYIMLAYSLKNLCNLYVQWQKYCFIVCMRVLFIWISHLISWWFCIWLFLRCVFSWKFWYILWCIFSKKSVWLVVYSAMVYLKIYIIWRVCITRCTMTKCLVICIYVLFC